MRQRGGRTSAGRGTPACALQIALLKLPYFVRGEQKGIEGAVPPFVVRPATRPSTDLRMRMYPARATASATDCGRFPVGCVNTRPRSTLSSQSSRARRFPRVHSTNISIEDYEVTGLTSRQGYRNILVYLGFVALDDDDVMSITEEGRAYLERRDPTAVFDRTGCRYRGMLEVLVIVQALGRAESAARLAELLQALMDTNWDTDNQVSFRRNWLLSLGMTERSADGDALADLGRAGLERYAAECGMLRERSHCAPRNGGAARDRRSRRPPPRRSGRAAGPGRRDSRCDKCAIGRVFRASRPRRSAEWRSDSGLCRSRRSSSNVLSPRSGRASTSC